MRRADIPAGPWSETQTVADFYDTAERTTYHLSYRSAGYDQGNGEWARWRPESWGIVSQHGMTTSRMNYKSEADARQAFRILKAQSVGG